MRDGNWDLAFGVLTSLGIILGAVWGHSLWLSKQFNSLKDLIYSKVGALEDVLLSKLEYHERHDDKRFSDLHNELWEMKLRNAAMQGLILDKKIENKK
jgi:hypothetical protein